jgi:cysteine desulfurase
MGKIYLDNAATTPVDKKVISSMKKYWRDIFANPSSIHSMGVLSKNNLDFFRQEVAFFLNAHSREIFFTASGTESNNLTILGVAKRAKENISKPHLITTEIEHSSVIECFKELERNGFEVDYIKVDKDGLINPKDLRDLIKKETVLISIGYVNSEIGVIQPIKDIAKEIRYKKKEFNKDKISYPYFHIDASQAVQYLNMNVEELGVDLVTLDAQKIYGPKGVGALFIKDGIEISPIIFGGGQEKSLRSGTENIPLISGFVESLRIVKKIKERESSRITFLRDWFFESIKKEIPEVIINGSQKERIPNNINISIPNYDGEMLVLRLDEKGIVCSSSSACASGSGESFVVRKIAEKENYNEKEIIGRSKTTLRFSLGRDTKKRHLKKLLKSLLYIKKIF